jgi:DNA (cytosine-5)-methyltransferase 1
MKYLSVCSGIEAASCAWRDLGWQAAAYSEIEPFPCAVLNHHFPDTPNWGDMTKWKDWPDATIDLLVGGTPCQSFSTAGLRKGLDDIRGQLAIGFSAIAERYRPKWIVWENVPGVLSSGGGRDFASFCQSLVKFGYGLCWRVLDAQHFGVPQRRRRVFVIGYLGNWRHSAAVLFEPESLRRDFEKSRQKGERAARHIAPCPNESNRDLICMSSGQAGAEIATNRSTTLTCLHEAPIVAQAFTVAEARRTGTIELKDQAPTLTSQTKRSDTEPCVLAFPERMSATQRATTEDLCPALGANNPTDVAIRTANTGANGHGVSIELAHTLDQAQGQAVAFHATRRDGGRILGDLSTTVEAHWGTSGGNVPNVAQSMQVRRLTPRECERLQGFPDDWTNVSRNGKPAPDGPRYKAIGNSMAVPVMRWIGQRIQMVENVANG